MVQDDGTRFAAAVALDGDPPSSLLRGVQVTTNATVGVLHSGSDQTHPRLRCMAADMVGWFPVQCSVYLSFSSIVYIF